MKVESLYSVRLREVRRAVMAWIMAVQARPEELVVAGAVAFIAVCERYGMPARRALEVAERLLRDADPVEARALRMYLDEELPK